MTKTANMMKLIVGGVWRLGRGTATMMGIAVLLAVTVGAASTALAGTGVGARFDLGKTNTVNQISKLVGSVAGPSLTVDNNSTAVGATALRLEVEPGKPPMSVNSTTEVQGLNVDSLDSKNSSEFLQESSDRDDFLPSDTYIKTSNFTDGPGNFQGIDLSVSCDPGDRALGGGGQSFGFRDHLNQSFPSSSSTWAMEWEDTAEAGVFQAYVICADFPPGR